MTLNYAKSCFDVKKLILTSERRAEHPFPGQNTQQTLTTYSNQWCAAFPDDVKTLTLANVEILFVLNF